MKIEKAVILCGGLGTRFLPITKSIPKEMLPVVDKPILQFLLEELEQAGIKQCLLILGRNKECIPNHFDRNIELENVLQNKPEMLKQLDICSKMEITYYRCKEPKGTGEAISHAKDFAGDTPVYMLFGDEIMFANPSQTKQMIDNFIGNTMIAVKQVLPEAFSRYGMIKIKDYNYKTKNKQFDKRIDNVVGIIEKPAMEESPSDFANLGASILTKDLFEKLPLIKPTIKGEYYLTDALEMLAQENKLDAVIIDGLRADMGNPVGFVEANVLACLNDERYKNEMQEFLKKLNI